VVDPPAVDVGANPGRLDDLRDLSGAPGAGYSTANRSSGKPKKSWIVRGRGIAVTAVALMYQCAETTSSARGRGRLAPSAAHASV
jgi:hypothetical protein